MLIVVLGLIALICVFAAFKILGNWFLPAHVATGIGRAVDNTMNFVGKLFVVAIGLGVLWAVGYLIYVHSTGQVP